jgi:D-alanyl-D-alanine carboxypeptidase
MTTDPAPRPAPDQPLADDERRAARLQSTLDRLVARGRAVHAVAGVATLDGHDRWQGAAGRARPDGTRMTPTTPFFVASVTKLHITATVLLLAEERRLDLDTPVTHYLPTEVTAGLHHRRGVDRTADITLRHLLSHTSGLPDFLEDRTRGSRSWYHELISGADRDWSFEDVVARTRELPARFDPQDLSAPR